MATFRLVPEDTRTKAGIFEVKVGGEWYDLNVLEADADVNARNLVVEIEATDFRKEGGVAQVLVGQTWVDVAEVEVEAEASGDGGGGGGGGTTNLAYVSASRTVTSSTGTNAVLTLAVSGGDAGLMDGADKAKLDGIEANATADQTDAEIETAYNNQVAQVSAPEATAGTEANVRRFAPADVKSMIDQHGGASLASSISPAADDGTGAVGTGTDAARDDHKHPAQGVSADANNATVAGTDGLHHTPIAQDAEMTAATAGRMVDASRFIDDDTMATASATNIPSAESVVAYIANQLGPFFQTPSVLDVGGAATFALPVGEVAGSSFIIANANAAGTAIGAANPITVNENDVIWAKSGVVASTDDGNDFEHIDAMDAVASVTVGGGTAQTGAVSIPTAAAGTEGVLDYDAIVDVTSDSDGSGKIIYRASTGEMRQSDFDAFQVVAIAAAPVDGTTVAYKVGQLFWDYTNKNLYEAVTKSTDPDSSGAGSTFSQVVLGAKLSSASNVAARDALSSAANDSVFLQDRGQFQVTADGSVWTDSSARNAFSSPLAEVLVDQAAVSPNGENTRIELINSSIAATAVNWGSWPTRSTIVFTLTNTSGSDTVFTFASQYKKPDGSNLGAVTVTTGTNAIVAFVSNGSQGTQIGNLEAAEAKALLFDSSAGVDAKTLPAMTGSGKVYFYANVDVASNAATLAPQTGESLNGVVDQVFNASNYANGTQFRVDDVATGQAYVSVVGAASAGNNPVVVSGAAAASTILDDTDSVWSSFQSTSPATGAIFLNPDFCHYTEENGIRYYNIRFYSDNDLPFTFKVDGAIDIANVVAQGYSLGSGDFANRMVFVSRIGPNEYTVDRDNDNDVDMYYEVTFVAFMQPSSVVLAGMVEPTTLDNARFSLSTDSSGSAVCPFDTTDFNENTTKYVLESGGGVTVQPGRYLVTVKPGRQGGLLDWELWNATAGTQVMVGRLDHAQAIDNTDHATGYLNVSVASEIQLRELDGDFTAVVWNGATDLYGCTIEFVELPNSTVVNPDSVPVEDVEVLLDSQTISSGGTLTLPVDVSAYEYIRFEVEDAGGGDVSVEGRCRATAISDCRIALHHDDATGYVYFDTDIAGTTATLTATVGFTGVMTARAIGVKAQKTVINTTDLHVDDQSASGYFDFGNMRIQWGTGSASSVTLPAPFADSSYSVVGQLIVNDSSGTYSIQCHTLTASGFSVNRNVNNTSTVVGTSTTYSWQAIGLKP